jgi:predicted amidophosphoribosyltransferase
MVATFLIVSDMKPYKWPRQFDLRSTDDKHVMAIDLALNAGKTKDEIVRILRESGASEVNEKNFE